MFPPQSNINLNLEALSGISGSISLACWVVVFSPQIIENFRRSSAEGLSIPFLVIWLSGDVFNIIGAVLQGVLPTMIILAVYYTLADIVLLLQVFWYRGFTLKDETFDTKTDNERAPLLSGSSPTVERGSTSVSDDFRRHLSLTNAEHLSPTTPLLNDNRHNTTIAHRDPPAAGNEKPRSTLQTIFFNSSAIILVCLAGTLGWYISKHHNNDINSGSRGEALEFNMIGQGFGYLCAVFYLASRVPQLLLNYKRKSTEGVSLLFFLFACIGNLTYDLSIFAYNSTYACEYGPQDCQPGEARAIYARYIAVNASWIAGSLGTLLLDGAIFWQFFLYRKVDDNDEQRVDYSNGHVTGTDRIAPS